MNGILNILKPPGMTSFDVIGFLRKQLKIKKIGHTGTLDPGAVGVLPVCIGGATKVIEFITEKDKLYRAELTLGTSTDTQDSTGNIIESREVCVTPEQINEAVQSFVGKIMQVPPMYSALKVGGKKLYELARNGITVERSPREINIHWINIISISGNNRVIFDVSCSKGTYIRTLCADIGEKLGCGGHMSFLLRLRSGAFGISTAITLEEVERLVKEQQIAEKLVKVEEVFDDLQSVKLEAADEKKLLNGVPVVLPNGFEEPGNLVKVYNMAGKFFSLAEVQRYREQVTIKSRKLFLEAD